MALGKYSRLDGRKSSTSYYSTFTFVVFIGLCLVGVWMMTSSSIVPVQNVDLSTQETKNEVQTELKEIDGGTSKSDESNNSSEDETTSESKLMSESNTSSDINPDIEINTNSENTSRDGDSNIQSSTSGDSNTNNDSNTNSESSTGGESNKSNESQPERFEDNPGTLPEDATKGDNTTASSNERNYSQSEKTSEHSTDDNLEQKPADDNLQEQKPADDNLEQKPVDDNLEEQKPANDNLEQKPVDENPQEQKPSDENLQEQKPVDDNPEQKPADDNVEQKPADDNVEQKPADDNLEQKPANQSSEEETNSDEGPKSGTANEEDTKEDVVSNTEDQESKDSENTSKPNGKNSVDEKNYSDGQGDREEDSKATMSKSDQGENKTEKSSEPQNTDKSKTEDTIEEKSEGIASEKELLPSGAQSELLNETMSEDGAWKTQAAESKKAADKSIETARENGSSWKLCNVTAGADYIPCLDNLQAIRSLKSTRHFEHKERHCPDDPPTCLVSVPEKYQRSIQWPTSREKIWYHNVPNTMLAEYKGHQNWVKVSGEHLIFPGGGTQMMQGALPYIDTIQQSVPGIAWGKRSRVVLDIGCGVASFGGFLFDRDALTMSFAPNDEHEAQVQFALERGIPAFIGVMGTKRLPFPGKVFDVIHCARCRVPWHAEGGKLLLELNRLLRPGGYFVWSATPVYQKDPEDVQIWEAMKQLLKAICWEVISIYKDRLNKVGVAVFQKPSSNECIDTRSEKEPPLCKDSDDPNASWNVLLQACMHKIPADATERGSKWPEEWPARLEKTPYWMLSSQVGVYGKPSPEDFEADYDHWKRVVSKSYVTGMGINWSAVRNVMDMRAIYGGFAAALKEMNVWVMNVVNIDSPDTLPIIYERGLFGMYHDWCESFNTYPRTYDLIHADHLFSKIKMKCSFEALVAEVDRILRPEGKLIVRDKVQIISELETMYKSMQWQVRMTYAKDTEGLLCVQKSMWRPNEVITLPYAIAQKEDTARALALKEELKRIPHGGGTWRKSKDLI